MNTLATVLAAAGMACSAAQAVTQTNCVPPPDGLVGWWRAENNGLDAAGTNHGTLANGIGFAAGRVGQAFHFDGVDDFVDIPYNPALFALAHGTLELWAKILDPSAGEVILFGVAKTGVPALGAGSHEWSLGYRGVGGSHFLQVGAVNGSNITSLVRTPTNSIADTNWHHIAVVADGVGMPEVYIDGVSQPLTVPVYAASGNDAFFAAAAGSDNMKIGALLRDTLLASQGPGQSLIDEVSIYNRGLSAPEVFALFAAGSAGKCPPAHCELPTSGLVSWWTGDGTARDLVGFADGGLQGTATYAPGRVGQAFSLDGTNGFVLIPHHRSLDPRVNYYGIAADPPASFTYEAWIQTTSATGWVAILGKVQCGNICFPGHNDAIQLFLEDGKPMGFVRDRDGMGPPEMYGGQLIGSTRAVADGQFHHLALVRDLGLQQLRLYVDGALDTNAPLGLGARGPISSGKALLLGAQEKFGEPGYFRHFRGLIDEVSWYHQALTTAEAQAIYAAAGAGKCRPARLNLSALGRGGVRAAPAGTNHFVGDPVVLTATNARYHRFLAWSDGVTNNPRLVTLGLSNDFHALFTNTAPLEELVFQQWDRSYGGAADDRCNSAVISQYGGFYLAGSSASGVSGNKTSPNRGGDDFWFLLIAPNGNVVENETYGGTNSETAYVVRPVTQDGWVSGGSSEAGGGGNKNEPGFAHDDFWIWIRVYPGQRFGDNSLGGAAVDQMFSLEETFDEGFIMAGPSTSDVTPGNVNRKTTSNLGGSDFWVVRSGIFASEKVWERTLGGTNDDIAHSARETRDRGFIVGGTSWSGVSGNKTASSLGGSDFWVVRLDSLGTNVLDRSYGTAQDDELRVVVLTADGGYALGGYTASPGSSNDFLIIRTDAAGNELWRTTVGGSGSDTLTSLAERPDGSFLAAGTSSSPVSGTKTAPRHGGSDYWLVCLDARGAKLWDASFGGTADDQCNSLVLTPDGALLAGTSFSATDGTKTASPLGGGDFWVVNVALRGAPVGTPVVLVNGQFAQSNSITVTNFAVIDLQSSFPGSHIFFTLDGSPPEKGIAFAGPFDIAEAAVIRAVAFDAGFAMAAEADPVIVNVLLPPVIITPPVDQQVALGMDAGFAVAAEGADPLAFQWFFNGTPLVNATNALLFLPNAQATNAGNFAVVVTNAFGAITSVIARLAVLVPARITTPPASLSVPPGTNVTFCVDAEGTPPVLYQWRLNGLNIPGATDRCFSIPNVQVTNGGSYSVVVANDVGAATSDPAVLIVEVSPLQAADMFAGRVALTGNSGTVAGTNTAAMRETGEPLHAGKPGGKSLWYKWQPAASGIATFDTRGSGFDTLLAIYTGSAVGALSPVAADEDSGGFYTSLVKLNVTSGMEYAIALDGFGGASGRFVLHWAFEVSPEIVPAITNQPQGVATSLGGSATFTVGAAASQPGLTYQWLFNGVTNAGATHSSFTVSNVGYADLGDYTVRVSHTNNPARFVESARAALEIGPVASAVSYDKLEDLLNAPPPPSDVGGGGFAPAGSAPAGGFIALRLGGFNGQVLGNTNSGTQAREPNHCNFIGNDRTRWFGLRAYTNGVMVLDTADSGIQTVMTVYGWTNYDNLAGNVVGCDIDTNLGSRVVFTLPPLAAGKHRDFLVAIDSIGAPLVLTNAEGRTNPVGLIRLNWRLGLPPLIAGVSRNQFIVEGSNADLAVTASNRVAPGVTNQMAAPRYQWSCNGTPRPGATNATLALPHVRLSDAGVYRVAVRNDIDAVFAEVRVAVLQPNVTSYVVSAGDNTTLGVTLAGDADCALGYQWRRNGQPLSGHTGPTISITGVSLNDAGQYSVIATNCFGSITSVVSTVSVAARSRISLGALADAGEFRFPPTSAPVCGVVVEGAPTLLGLQTLWQPIATNFNPQAVIALPLDAALGRFYRARLLLCP